MITSTRSCDNSTWLPVQQRVLFKIAVLVFQCPASQTPSYSADDFQLVSDARQRRLCSSDLLTCSVRRTRNTYGDRCFAAAGPRIWNSLPAELRLYDFLRQFRRRLKTYSFRDMGSRHSVTLSWQRRIEIFLLTYLLLRLKF